MKTVSRIQLVCLAGVIAAFALLVRYGVVPLGCALARNTGAIAASIRGGDVEELNRLEQQNQHLKALQQRIETLAGSGNTSAQWYAFLVDKLAAQGITARKTSSSQHSIERGLRSMQYALQCSAAYHTVGRLVNELESGPFVCAVRDVELVSKSLVASDLDVSMTVTFYGAGQ